MSHFEKESVIAAVKDENTLSAALESNCKYIFLLKANINTAAEIVERCHAYGRRVYIHIDLAEGFGKDFAGINYIAHVVKPDGILSTKTNIIKMSQEIGMFAILRIFLIDAQSMDSAVTNIEKLRPDAVEIMPGIAYEAVAELKKKAEIDVIAGGFLRTRENLLSAFAVGAAACSTSNTALWHINK